MHLSMRAGFKLRSAARVRVIWPAFVLLLAAASAPPGQTAELSTGRPLPPNVRLTGHPTADEHYIAAVVHQQALGRSRDLKQALQLYCRAAEHDHIDAAYAVGWMLLNGRGMEADVAQAAAWLGWAAQRGHGAAQGVLRLIPSARPAKRLPCNALVRDDSAPMAGGLMHRLARAPREIRNLATEVARNYGVDPNLVLSVIAVESAFDPHAVSPANARGLMQLIPGTARRFGVRDMFDAEQNVRGGVKYLAWLARRFDGDLDKVLAAYNAGENAVDRYDGIPPYAETRDYVRKVRSLYDARRADARP